jgi:putative sigma-54 modulation protein
MRIEIVSRKLRYEKATTEHIHRRVHFALGRFAGAIRGVQVCLMDENGPRGGEDKRCRVIVSLNGGERLVLERSAASLHDAVDQSLQHAGHSLGRSLGRKHPRLDLGRNLWPPASKN